MTRDVVSPRIDGGSETIGLQILAGADNRLLDPVFFLGQWTVSITYFQTFLQKFVSFLGLSLKAGTGNVRMRMKNGERGIFKMRNL